MQTWDNLQTMAFQFDIVRRELISKALCMFWAYLQAYIYFPIVLWNWITPSST